MLLLAGAVLLLLVCLQLGVGAQASDSAATSAAPVGRAAVATTQSASGAGDKATTQSVGWSRFSKSTDDFGDTGLAGPLWQMIGIVVIIAVLGVGGLLMVRRYAPRIQQRRGRHISVVETTGLGPNKSLHLLRVGDRDLLISSTRERVSMLADVTGAVGESFEQVMEREDNK